MRKSIIHLSVLLSLALALGSPVVGYAFITCYVNSGAGGGNTGLDWTNAYTSLQSALTNLGCGEIWVAAGVYKPTATTDRAISFVVPANVAVYGGFLSGDTFDDRDPAANVTILSGDIDNNDDSSNADGNYIDETTADISGNNSYRVVAMHGYTTPVTAFTVLDGFTITGGQGANQGAGLLCDASGAAKGCSPTLSNLTFSGNFALQGGGMASISSASAINNPVLTNVTFTGNTATNSGGAMLTSFSGVPSLTSVTFSNNHADIAGGAWYNMEENAHLANVIFSTNTAQYGGALYNATLGYTSNPILTNVTFTDNDATVNGGAVFNDGSTAGSESSPSFTNVTFTDSDAGGNGGAMYNDAHNSGLTSPTLTNVTFSNNSAVGDGGAIYNNAPGGGVSNPVMTNAVFTLNTADNNGGAMFSNGSGGESSPVLSNVEFSGNSATGGGGMFNFGEGGNSSPTLSNVTFVGNSAASGGAIFNDGYGGQSSPVLTNVTFSLNTADYNGGAMYDSASGGTSSPTLTNVTFSQNSANYGGALFGDAYAGTSIPTLTNVILWDDIATTYAPEIYQSDPPGPTIGYSVVAGGCGSIAGATCGAGNLDTNPLLAPLNYNGGFTQTMALVAGSPAIESGDNATCAAAPVNNLDQRGVTRPQGGHCDIGAYEYVHVFWDVPAAGKQWMEPWIDAFHAHGITTGCGGGPLIYCPENQVTRAEMAVFLLRAKHGAGYAPPAPTHDFADVPVTGKEWMEPWIEQFYAEGITTGCGGGNYCPENNVTRAEMAVFVLRALHGGGYAPPAGSGLFADVPVSGKEWMEPWIIEFANEGITTGCGGGNYCPENNVTRAEMAVFIDRAYHFYP